MRLSAIAQQWLQKIEAASGAPTKDGEVLALVDRIKAQVPEWGHPLLEPRRYKCLWGGRGSGKSFCAADILLAIGIRQRIRVLCAREFQNSIKESVHFLLKERITALGLERYYTVQESAIVGSNGTSFIFKGIRHNTQSIKSTTGITHCWVEEGQTISRESWDILVPTIREEGSEIWVTFNPLHESDPVYQELVVEPPPNSYVEQVNWDKNPYFTSVLDEERRRLQAKDPNLYNHIWEGGFLSNSNAQILNGKWAVEEFTPEEHWDGPYHGADWGFGTDPTVAVRSWIFKRVLYIEYESYAHNLELGQISRLWLADIPGIDRYTVRADNSQPATIQFVKKGMPQNDIPPIPKLEPVEKWAGSVEDGIKHLRNYDRIVIHPRCKHTIEESRLYSYKVDRMTGDVLPVIVDAFNHAIDSLRYSLAPLIRRKGGDVVDRMKALLG